MTASRRPDGSFYVIRGYEVPSTALYGTEQRQLKDLGEEEDRKRRGIFFQMDDKVEVELAQGTGGDDGVGTCADRHRHDAP